MEESEKEKLVLHRDELIANAEAYTGVKSEVLAGALHGISEPIAIEEVKRIVDEFIKRKVL